MNFSALDIVTFVGFIALVIGVSLYASRKKGDSTEDYFLAGRKLSWWLIGLSLIASNISSEHFIGMSGKGYGLGMGIASYEWMAAITLIIVAIVLLPRFLKAGIYTIPQYLELRYDRATRTLMSILMLVFFVFVTLATVLYSGALALQEIFNMDMVLSVWLIGILAGAYTVYGGLRAVVWSDLIQGTALLIGGFIVLWLGLEEVGGWDKFVELSGDKLHAVLPADNTETPWTAVFIGGLWIPNLFYWGLNQFITQRTLGAKSIEEGQRGILFGATLKLLIPFIVVFPGIIAFELYGDQIIAETGKEDGAYPYLLNKLLPSGLLGVMFAALFGAVMSTLDSLLNSAATIFTLDIYKPFFLKNKPEAQKDPKRLVAVGRIVTLILVVLGCLWAPLVGELSKNLYDYIQASWGLIQPGILAAFVFGILWKKVPAKAVFWGMILGIPVYGGMFFYVDQYVEGGYAFLHLMAYTFVIVAAFITVWTLISPNTKENKMPEKQDIDHKLSATVIVWSIAVFVATVALYIIFA